MSKTLATIYSNNPVTTILNNDLLYLVNSPYTPGTDAGITGASLKALFLQPSNNLSDLSNASISRTSLGLTGAATMSLPVSGTNGGTGVNNGASTITIGGNLAFSGAFSTTFTVTGTTTVTLPTSGTLATTSQIPALPLSLANGGSNADLSVAVSNGGIVWTNATQMQVLAGTSTANQILLSGSSVTPGWSTTTYPATNAINTIMYASSANVLGVIAAVNGGVLVSNNSGVPSMLANPAAAGKVLQSGNAAIPTWSTPTYPSASGGAGVLLRSDGTNYVATTSTYPNTNAINTLLYASAANVMSALTTGNNGVLVTSNTGVPSINTSLAQGLVVASSVLTVGAANNIPFNTTKGIQDNNGNSQLLFTVTASAVNYINITNNSTGNKPIITGTGSDSNVLLSLQNKGNSGVEIQGTTAAGNATAGFVGEFISSVITQASPVSISTGVSKTITSISLTAGDWDVWGNVGANSSATMQGLAGGLNTTNNTLPNPELYTYLNLGTGAIGTESSVPVPMLRANINSTTIYYLVINVAGTGTLTGYGGLYARRMR